MTRYKLIKYDRINTSNAEIRIALLMPAKRFDDPIHCGLHHASIKEQPAYDALSYVWADPPGMSEIYVRGQPFEVTKNLASALRHLRYPDRVRRLWVDAICINQRDEVEKGEQVSQMDWVYAQSDVDLVWMGAEYEKYNRAMNVFCRQYSRNWTECQAQTSKVLNEADDMTWISLLKFFDASIWKRMWIVQELASSPCLTIVCGRKQLQWPVVDQIAFHIYSDPWYATRTPFGPAQGIQQIHHLTAMYHFLDIKDYKSEDMPGFLKVWSTFGWCHCKFSQDKIFAILNILEKIPDVKRFDYNQPIRDLYSKLARSLILDKQNLELLGYRHRKPHTVGSTAPVPTGHGIPSWVPDFGLDENPYVPQFFLYHYEKQGHTSLLPWSNTSTNIVRQSNLYQLPLLGITLDEIVYTSDCTETWPSAAVDKYYGQLQGKVISRFRPNTKYFNGDSLSQAYFLTLCAGYARVNETDFQVVPLVSSREEHSRDPVQSRKPTAKESSWKRLFSTKPRTKTSGVELQQMRTETKGKKVLHRQEEYPMTEHILVSTRNQCFALTKDGYFALVSDDCHPGDNLVVLNGGVVPFVLREMIDKNKSSVKGKANVRRNYWQCMGPAYVHGFMTKLPLRWKETGIRHERQFVLL